MKKQIHKSEERGKSELDWLSSRFSFSFADYFNPERMGFGALLVLNDDMIKPGTGFGMHSHRDMEIITIVNEGILEHKDSLNSIGIVEPGEIQVMSAGTGIIHSEYNHSKEKPLKLFQIWIIPNNRDLKPRYDQRKFDFKDNELTEVVSGKENKNSLFINQDAKISIGIFDKNKSINYSIDENKGCFVFVVNGEISLENEILKNRDSIEISDTDKFEIKFKEKSKIIIIEVPMR